MSNSWLDLLVTLETPDGRQTQALTLLFDPPGTPSAQASGGGFSRAVAGIALAAPSGAEGSRGPVYINRGDTLWSLAESVKPSQASNQQMMLALLKANESRFPSGNVNDMWAGYTLEMPTDEAIFSQSSADARRMLDAMNKAWGNRSSEPTLPDLALSPQPASPTPVASARSVGASETSASSDTTPLAEAALAKTVLEDEVGSTRQEPVGKVAAQAIETAQALNSQLREARLDKPLDLPGQEPVLVQAATETLANEMVTSSDQALATVEGLPLQEVSNSQVIGQAADTDSLPADLPANLGQATANSQEGDKPMLRDSHWLLAAAAFLLLLPMRLLIRRRQARK